MTTKHPPTIVHPDTGEVLHFVTVDAEGNPVYGRKSIKVTTSDRSHRGGTTHFTGRT